MRPASASARRTSIAGFIVVSAGYCAAFLFLAAVASVALAVYWIAMPEMFDSPTRSKPAAAPNAAGI
jgi:hypothetical protein